MQKKISWPKGNMLYPLPVVLVSCGDAPENYNLITIAWTGTLASDPPMCYISIRKIRHSYEIIKRCGEFVINLTTQKLVYATDWCGVRSGKNFNKFKEMGLTPVPAKIVKAPILLESPLSIECVVKQIIPLGSHDMFIAEVVNINADAKYIDSKSGRFDMKKANLIAYSHGSYCSISESIGSFGFSVKKRKNKVQPQIEQVINKEGRLLKNYQQKTNK